MQDALGILEQRGFLYQITDAETVRRKLSTGTVTFYVGFDPTADSLHVGHLLPVMAMRWLQQCGHRAIAVVGGGTAMVGDPSGRTESRPILTTEQIDANAQAIKRQLARYLDFSADRALLLNNADWLADLNYIEFLRDIGKHFSVNRMLAAESVKQRLETGLSFLEFNYTLLQAFDFLVLCREHDCTLQLGGQDQWGNIVAGADLTRRVIGAQVHGATLPLLLKSDGAKFGKSASGAVWLDPRRTSPHDYYQFWRNVDDADVLRLLGFFTPLAIDEVKRLGALNPPEINRAKEILAYEATSLAHGSKEAARAFLSAGSEFGFADPSGRIPTSSAVAQLAGSAETAAELPTHTIKAEALEQGVGLLQLFTDSGLCRSNGEARRLVRGGGAYVNGERVGDETRTVTTSDLDEGQITLRAGKKNLRRVIVSEPQ